MNDKWQELREAIQGIHESHAEDADVETVTQFLLNLMDVLDRKKTEQMTITYKKNCDNCMHYSWYYDWCKKFKIEVDGREVHDCFEERLP